jgi:hypothetical protein
MIPQSSWVAGFLGVGFIVFITARGELASYLGIILGSAPSALQVSGFSVPLQSDLPNISISPNTAQNTSAALTPLTTTPSSTVTDTIPLESLQGFTF